MAIRGQHMVHAGLHAWVRLRGYRLAPRDLTIGGGPLNFWDAVPIWDSLQLFSCDLTHYCRSYGDVRLVPWLGAWFDAGFRWDFLAGVIAVVVLSSQSQTERETTQQAPRYISDSVGCLVYMPCNARLVTVTPESAVCISDVGTLGCSCRGIVSSLVCMRNQWSGAAHCIKCIYLKGPQACNHIYCHEI